jgi:hypothetical protein
VDSGFPKSKTAEKFSTKYLLDIFSDNFEVNTRFALFDTIVGNTNRHKNNYLVVGEKRFIAIDNGMSFSEYVFKNPFDAIDYYFKGFMRSAFFLGDKINQREEYSILSRQIPKQILDDIKNVNLKDFQSMLEGIISNKGAVKNAVQRLKTMQDLINKGKLNTLSV